jgi:hypothetical protein
MSNSYDFSSRVVVDPDVLSRVVGDETVILNLKTELYLGLNDTGTRIWTALAGARTIQEAYDQVLEEFEVSSDELRTDMQELLDALVRQRVIEVMPAE